MLGSVHHFRPAFGLLALGCGLTIPVSACDVLNPSEGAEEARVEIEGSNSTALDLVTSSDFTILIEPETSAQSVALNDADTSALASLPFDRTYDIRANDRFFVRLMNPDTVNLAPVSMKVTVDGRVLYNSTGEIGGTTLLEFLYRLSR